MTEAERVPAESPSALLPSERERLAELEAVVQRGIQTFIEVGMALSEIRDARLYRETHDTFKAYCLQRWDISRAEGYRMIDEAKVAAALSPMGDIPNRRILRELVPLLREGDGTILLECLLTARRKYGDAMTAQVMRGQVAVWLAELRRKPGYRTAWVASRSRSNSSECKCGRCGYSTPCPKCGTTRTDAVMDGQLGMGDE